MQLHITKDGKLLRATVAVSRLLKIECIQLLLSTIWPTATWYDCPDPGREKRMSSRCDSTFSIHGLCRAADGSREEDYFSHGGKDHSGRLKFEN